MSTNKRFPGSNLSRRVPSRLLSTVVIGLLFCFAPASLIADEDEDDATPIPAQAGPSQPHDWDTDEDDEDDDEPGDDEDEEDDEEDEDFEDPEVSVGLQWNQTHSDDAPFELLIGGYLRAGYTNIQNDQDIEYIGRRDGFILHDARLELDGQLRNGLGFVFEVDGAVSRQSGDSDDPAVPLRLRLKDASIYYEPFDWLRADVGQFKPAFDVEEQTSTSDLLFVNRSVGARGVKNIEGFNVDGLSVGRELGARLQAGPYFPQSDDNSAQGPGGSLTVSATNGQSPNTSLNDNEHLAYAARGTLHWGKYVRLGGAYYHNNQSIGSRPDRLGIVRSGWTADVSAEYKGATLIGSIIRMHENAEQRANELGQSIQAQVAYEEPFLGLQPAYRFALYDPTLRVNGEQPNAGSPADVDQRLHHTIGLNYRAKNYPIVLMANYTLAQESETRDIDNNRFDALLQLSW